MAMQNIGERLEEARKRKGISIREAAEATKIRGDYLQKFEANTFDLDLPPLYIRGFVRSYARYLELDTDKVLQDFGAATAPPGKAQKRDTREVYGRVDFNEASERGAGPEEESRPAGAAGRSPVDQAMLLKYGVLGGGALIAVLLIILVINMLSSKPGPPTARQSTPAVQAQAAQTLTLTAVDSTRVKVVQDLDGKVLFNGALARGETRSLTKQGALLITVEIGKNLRTEVNGRNYPVPIDGYGRYALD